MISWNLGIAIPSSRHSSAPMRRDGSHRYTNASAMMKTGQRYDGKIRLTGSVKAMTPGKKFGIKSKRENHAKDGIV